MTPKAVFRKVMSTFDHDIGTINYLSKQIPDSIPDIETACTISDALGQAQNDFPIEFKVLSMLQFTISHEGKHAGGVVIYNQLSNHLPIKTLGEDRNDRIVAFDMDVIHDLHFFKFDILGLETIGIINNTLLTINKNIDLNTIDYNDENVYDDLCKGDVSGVFQLSNQRQKVIEQQPRSFIDLVAINALIRPK